MNQYEDIFDKRPTTFEVRPFHNKHEEMYKEYCNSICKPTQTRLTRPIRPLSKGISESTITETKTNSKL